MAKKKTTEAINREQEVMEEKEALPSFFTNLFSSASNPLPNRAVLEYNIMHSAPVKANTEGYRAMMKVDKRTAEDIKHRLPCITPSVQLKGNAKKLTDFRKETYWLMLDYDDVPPEDIAALKKKALKQRFTMIFYITVSGKGFRILLRYMHHPGGGGELRKSHKATGGTEQEKADGGGKTQKEKPPQTGRRGATQDAHHRRDSAVCRQTGGELGGAV